MEYQNTAIISQLHKIYISLKGPIYLHYFAIHCIAMVNCSTFICISALCLKHFIPYHFLAKTIIRIISLSWTYINLQVFMCSTAHQNIFAWILFRAITLYYCALGFCIKRRKWSLWDMLALKCLLVGLLVSYVWTLASNGILIHLTKGFAHARIHKCTRVNISSCIKRNAGSSNTRSTVVSCNSNNVV